MTRRKADKTEQREGSLAPELQIRPDREGFDKLSREWALIPVWAELLADVSTPVGLFHTVRIQPLDRSASRGVH